MKSTILDTPLVITATVRSYIWLSDVSHLHHEYKQQSHGGEHEQEDAAQVLRPQLLALGTVLHVCFSVYSCINQSILVVLQKQIKECQPTIFLFFQGKLDVLINTIQVLME